MKRWGNHIIGACCALFVSVMLVPTKAYDKAWHILSGPNAAGWAQAFGSFVAVGAAIFIANSDSRKRRRQDEDARATALCVVAEVAENAASALREAETLIEGPGFVNAGVAAAHFSGPAMAVENATAALDALPLFQIPSGAELIGDLFKLRAMTIEAHAILVRQRRLATDLGEISGYATSAAEIAERIKSLRPTV